MTEEPKWTETSGHRSASLWHQISSAFRPWSSDVLWCQLPSYSVDISLYVFEVLRLKHNAKEHYVTPLQHRTSAHRPDAALPESLVKLTDITQGSLHPAPATGAPRGECKGKHISLVRCDRLKRLRASLMRRSQMVSVRRVVVLI